MVEKDLDKRWEEGMEHHTESIAIKEAIRKLDAFGMYSFGGDGDNGEDILYFLDVYFECKDKGEEV